MKTLILLFIFCTISFSNTFYDINLTKIPKYIPPENPIYKQLTKEFVYVQLYGFAVLGVIGILPESISHWDKDEEVNLRENFKKRADNVSPGPVIDHDDPYINFIGHPLSGSYYYVWGRQAGLSRGESFLLTTFMSTVYWEYGWESFSEPPSIQDLLVTPIVGTLLGELTNHYYNILKGKDDLLGSSSLRSLSMFLINPIGELNSKMDLFLGDKDIDVSMDYNYNLENYNDYNDLNPLTPNSQYIKFNIRYKY